MCNQSVGLIQRAVEATGISTTSITLDESITKRVKPPRALSVPYRFGYPLGEPNNPELQHAIIAEALSLLENEETPPILKVAGTLRVP
ncbi:hypothetical protein F4Z99_13375 [Candidatus Poribacteria bacterium]|nr:hypothetical protein [Candidatus Poribacteria bacterium]MYA98226.1 hypothetical protein [Candidatus Poribacteria bacterium]